MPAELFSNPKFVLSKNLKIGVLAGGSSSERKISLRSGRAVLKALKRSHCQVQFLDPRNKSRFRSALKKIDLAFIALHGRGGEDGTLQQFLEKKKIPYIGSDASSSRKAFDKGISKKIFLKSKIPTAPYRIFNASNCQKKLSAYPVPFFVKPVREGSSIGAFAVEDFPKEAEKIRKTARQFGTLMAEPKIEGREFTVGVLGKRALPVIELRPKNSFYDYQAKYTKGMTDYVVPAKITPKLAKKLQKIALKAHKALGLRDFSRVDFMVDASDRPFVLEANSIPGFTELSLLPKAAGVAGITFENLCLYLVGCAEKRVKGEIHGKKEKT